jgi:hypothetical protein
MIPKGDSQTLFSTFLNQVFDQAISAICLKVGRDMPISRHTRHISSLAPKGYYTHTDDMRFGDNFHRLHAYFSRSYKYAAKSLV